MITGVITPFAVIMPMRSVMRVIMLQIVIGYDDGVIADWPKDLTRGDSSCDPPDFKPKTFAVARKAKFKNNSKFLSLSLEQHPENEQNLLRAGKS